MKPDEVKKPLVDGTDKCMAEHGKIEIILIFLGIMQFDIREIRFTL